MPSGLDFRNLRDGNRVLVFYLPETDDFEPGAGWGERRLLCRVTETIWVVLPRDPDYDEEDLAYDVQPFGTGGGFTTGLPRNQLAYTFPPGRWDGFLAEFVAEGLRLAGRRVRLPQSTDWFINAHANAHQPEKDRYYWWPSIMRLCASGAGADGMLFLAELSEAAITYDHFDARELLCFDIFCRRYQRWYEMYSTKLVPGRCGPAHEDWLDERHVFFGKARLRCAALIFPELEAYVTRQLEEQSTVLKERRQARERLALVGILPSEQPPGSEGPTGSGGDGSAGGRGNWPRGGRGSRS